MKMNGFFLPLDKIVHRSFEHNRKNKPNTLIICHSFFGLNLMKLRGVTSGVSGDEIPLYSGCVNLCHRQTKPLVSWFRVTSPAASCIGLLTLSSLE